MVAKPKNGLCALLDRELRFALVRRTSAFRFDQNSTGRAWHDDEDARPCPQRFTDDSHPEVAGVGSSQGRIPAAVAASTIARDGWVTAEAALLGTHPRPVGFSRSL